MLFSMTFFLFLKQRNHLNFNKMYGKHVMEIETATVSLTYVLNQVNKPLSLSEKFYCDRALSYAFSFLILGKFFNINMIKYHALSQSFCFWERYKIHF